MKYTVELATRVAVIEQCARNGGLQRAFCATIGPDGRDDFKRIAELLKTRVRTKELRRRVFIALGNSPRWKKVFWRRDNPKAFYYLLK